MIVEIKLPINAFEYIPLIIELDRLAGQRYTWCDKDKFCVEFDDPDEAILFKLRWA